MSTTSKKKKKAPKNAFSFYLDEAMVELRQEGIALSGKHEAVPYVHEKWKRMSAAEKAPYEERAKEWKMNKNMVPGRPGRMDCTGNSIDDRIDMDKQLLDERKEQRKYLLDRWAEMSKQQVADEHFYIISFQSYFEFPNEEGYQPCEVACVDYSLKGGICREWHNMINPGPIKMGLGAESKIFSDRTHQIPIWGFEAARKDHYDLWRELMKFVNPTAQKIYPPIFSKVAELKKNRFCMDYLAQLAGLSNRLSKIYQWEGLASALYSNSGIQSPSVNVIEDGANGTMYDYEANTKCDYHDEIECIYCAMLTVKKCCYWMSDAFSQLYGYKVTENHLPARQPPLYTIVRPESQPVPKPRKPFIGSGAMSDYNPASLPDCTQGLSDFDVYSSDSSVRSAFSSTDIRYRAKYRVVEPAAPLGRGCTIPGNTSVPAVDDTASDSLSVTDTLDDITSYVSDSDSDTTCAADDEGSEVSYGSKNRMPKTRPIVVDQYLPSGLEPFLEPTTPLEPDPEPALGADDGQSGDHMPPLTTGLYAPNPTMPEIPQLWLPRTQSRVGGVATRPTAPLQPLPSNARIAGDECEVKMQNWKPFRGRGRGFLFKQGEMNLRK